MEIAEIQSRFYRNKVLTSNGSIELPEAIDQLVDNKMYRNKFKSLIRRGYERELLELADLANDKEKPSFWFAKVTSKANWERTLDFLEKLHKVERLASEVAARIHTKNLKPVYKACWQLGETVVQPAITAQETGRDKIKYFFWLVKQKRYNTDSYVGNLA